MERADPRVRAALLEQLARRRETLTAGARHVGWKLGVGDRERIGDALAVGYLTTATVLAAGTAYRTGGLAAALHADVEVALELARDVDPGADRAAARAALGGFAVALEIVDLAPVLTQPEAVVASNVFHRAVAFGASRRSLPEPPVSVAAYANGECRARASTADDVAARLVAAARTLATVGERLRAGDRVITGSIVQIPVAEGETVWAEIDGLGAAELQIAP